VLLEVDHIHPVAEGGENDSENLITACEDCNRGKSSKLLTDRIVRPDADLMYLEAMQEAAELQRYLDSKHLRNDARTALINDIQNDFAVSGDLDWYPTARTIECMLWHNSPEDVSAAATTTGRLIATGKFGSYARNRDD